MTPLIFSLISAIRHTNIFFACFFGMPADAASRFRRRQMMSDAVCRRYFRFRRCRRLLRVLPPAPAAAMLMSFAVRLFAISARRRRWLTDTAAFAAVPRCRQHFDTSHISPSCTPILVFISLRRRRRFFADAYCLIRLFSQIFADTYFAAIFSLPRHYIFSAAAIDFAIATRPY
jgi:hypothetical protein